MARHDHQNTSKKLIRSSSHECLSLSPSAIIHPKANHYDADSISYRGEDDTLPKSISIERIVSSASENASSATVSVLEKLLLNSKSLANIFVAKEQPKGPHITDLGLHMNFLPGEQDVQLQRNVYYHNSNPNIKYEGELIVTEYRLLFVEKSSTSVQVLVDIPLGMISQIEKIGGHKRSTLSDTAVYGIEINCKDLRHFVFGNAKTHGQRRSLFEDLNRLVFPLSFNQINTKEPSTFFNYFFAYKYKQAVCPNVIDEGWKLYDKTKEYIRMGIQMHGDSHWLIDTETNKNYQLCDTYPEVLVRPANFDSEKLKSVASFRSRNRIPVLSWYCREHYITIARASQPLTGLARKNQDDVDYLLEIAHTNLNEKSRLFIMDARPKLNAMANIANGGGYENYPDCELEFENIENIHVMRESFNKLYTTLRRRSPKDKMWLSELTESGWLHHIDAILTSANRIVSLVCDEKRSVLVHCSDGWDRTAQLTSLAMLMLDKYYRTLNGFMILIEKEWISFGHQFLLRVGHGDKIYSERSPVFLQFLDCTYQLLQQFNSAFEFNEHFLVTIADCLYTCQYGTFLMNSDKARADSRISQYTMSAWTPILNERRRYLNVDYNDKDVQILKTNSSHPAEFWSNYYFRYVNDYQST